MKGFVHVALLGTSMLAAPSLAAAQQTPAAAAPGSQASGVVPQTGPAGEATDASGNQADTTGVTDPAVGDIVVTARRQSESLQNVPSTIQAISGESVQKLNFTQFNEIAALVPGLTLGNGNFASGGAPAPSIRGVSYDVGASPSPTVDIYFNEVPIDAATAFQAIYDLGGVEVLRGPQGTLRGRTAPSGAILLSTRKPDLANVGGYVSMLGTEKGSINGQAAINVPVVTDKLAVRVAAVVDQGPGNFVRSANGGVDRRRNTESGRASVSFAPFDALDGGVVYQYTHNDSRQYGQLEGNGSPGGFVSTAPAGYNGPRIAASDRLTPGEAPRYDETTNHLVTGNLNLHLYGHTLSYVGGYSKRDNQTRNPQDGANLVRGDFFQLLHSTSEAQSHEVRLSSDDRAAFLSYTLGYFHSYNKSRNTGTSPASFFPGAFGSPASTPNPALFDPRYLLSVNISSNSRNKEDSFFGSATLQLGQGTELTGGIRYIISQQNAVTDVSLGSGLLARALGFPCALAGFSSTYPGYCDIPVNLGTRVSGGANNQKNRPVVYNVSLSHRFSESLLGYATVGSSWRRGGTNFFINNGENAGELSALTFLPNETSTSYEVGLKTNFFDRRVRFNIAGFYQKFKNLNYQIQGIPYLSSNGATTTVEAGSFNYAADAVVKGFDADLSFAATPLWNIGLTASYADGLVDDQAVPCRDANFDGQPDAGDPTIAQFRQRAIYFAQCNSNQPVSRDPLWSATAQSEIRQPIGQSEAYLRGLVSYYPKNSRRNSGYRVPSYSLVNLYAGLRSPDGAWDVGVFARNLLDTGVRLSREPIESLPGGNLVATFGPSGYREVTYTNPFEAGLSVRFAFGAR